MNHDLPAEPRSSFKEHYLAKHGDSPSTREVFRFFDANRKRIQDEVEFGPIERFVRVEDTLDPGEEIVDPWDD